MGKSDSFHRIVVAVAAEQDAVQSLPLVTALAEAFSSEVLAVHLRERVVKATGTIEKETIKESAEFGRRMADDLVKAGIKASAEVHGVTPQHVGDHIIDRAKDFDADLIVVGAHHAHGLHDRVPRQLLRSLAT